jgi:hypothetical protein
MYGDMPALRKEAEERAAQDTKTIVVLLSNSQFDNGNFYQACKRTALDKTDPSEHMYIFVEVAVVQDRKTNLDTPF